MRKQTVGYEYRTVTLDFPNVAALDTYMRQFDGQPDGSLPPVWHDASRTKLLPGGLIQLTIGAYWPIEALARHAEGKDESLSPEGKS